MNRFALVAGAVLAASGSASAQGTVASPSPADLLYVANEASGVVSVIDLRDRSVRVVDLKGMGYGDNPKPHHIVVEPDGAHWYVSLIARDRVLKFDRANRLVDSVAFEVPGLMVLSPDGRSLFVGRSMSAVNAPQRVGKIDLATMDLEEFEVFVPMPHAIAVDPKGEWLFTGSMHENTLVRLDPQSGQADLTRLEAAPEVAHALVHYAVSPDGRTLVSTAQLTNKLLVFDISTPPAMKLVREIEVGAQPWYPTYTPDGRSVWFGNLAADEVTVVDTSTWTVADVIKGEGIAQPHGIVVSPDGQRVYLSNRNTSGAYHGRGASGFGDAPGTVVIIDAHTRRILDVIEVPPYGAGVGMAGAR